MNSLLKKKKKDLETRQCRKKKKQSLYLDEKFVPFFIYKKKEKNSKLFGNAYRICV